MFQIDFDDFVLKVDGWTVSIDDIENGYTAVATLSGLDAAKLITELFTVSLTNQSDVSNKSADLCGSTDATRCGARCDC